MFARHGREWCLAAGAARAPRRRAGAKEPPLLEEKSCVDYIPQVYYTIIVHLWNIMVEKRGTDDAKAWNTWVIELWRYDRL